MYTITVLHVSVRPERTAAIMTRQVLSQARISRKSNAYYEFYLIYIKLINLVSFMLACLFLNNNNNNKLLIILISSNM